MRNKLMSDKICAYTDSIKELLLEKDKAYGSSFRQPLRVFSKAEPIDGLLVRLDDKLSRIKNGGINSKTEDTVDDIIGYLILLQILLKDEKDEETNI